MRNIVDRLLVGVLVVLSASVLVTGGLAVYLTLARQGGAVASNSRYGVRSSDFSRFYCINSD